jgi:dTMP kinase
MTSAEPPRSAASLITSGPFARFWWAAAIGSTGDWVTLFATIAVADRIAGSAGILVAMIARVLPGLVFAPFVGVITDRVDRRKLIVIADLGRALLVPLLAFATELPFLVLVTIGLELLSLLGQSPRAASVPRLVAPQNIVTANSLLLAAAYGTIPLGAAFNWVLTLLPPLTLGGLIPAQNADFAMAFFVNSATFVISAALVASLPALRTSRAEREETGGKRAGWRETTTDLAEGARLVHRDVTFGVATVAAGLGLSSSAMTDTVFGASAWMVVMGFGAGAAYVMGLSYLHEVVADDLRGRVFATLFALMRVGLFVSMAVAVPLEGLFARLGSGFLFDDEIRSVLFFGGVVIMAAGGTVVWVLRGVIVRPKVGEEARSLLEEAGRALRFRRSRVEDEDKDS